MVCAAAGVLVAVAAGGTGVGVGWAGAVTAGSAGFRLGQSSLFCMKYCTCPVGMSGNAPKTV